MEAIVIGTARPINPTNMIRATPPLCVVRRLKIVLTDPYGSS